MSHPTATHRSIPATASANVLIAALAIFASMGLLSPAVAAARVPASESATPTPSITVAAVGDVAFVSSVSRLITAKGATAPILGVKSLTSSADLTIANLETAISTRGKAVAGKTFTFRSSPSSLAALTGAGVDVVSLANNHVKDFGSTALNDTVRYLDSAGILHAGAGKNSTAAFAPTYAQVNGATVAYLAFSQIGPSNFLAGSATPGTAYTLNLGLVKRAVAAAATHADYVVVSFHWGVERSYSPTARQVQFGRAAIDAGADAVLSHHPHVLQGIEYYKSGVIAYSLGNFVFSPGSSAGRDTMVLHLELTPSGVGQATAYPCYIKTTGATVRATGATAKRILGVVRSTSKARGSIVSVAADYSKATVRR